MQLRWSLVVVAVSTVIDIAVAAPMPMPADGEKKVKKSSKTYRRNAEDAPTDVNQTPGGTWQVDEHSQGRQPQPGEDADHVLEGQTALHALDRAGIPFHTLQPHQQDEIRDRLNSPQNMQYVKKGVNRSKGQQVKHALHGTQVSSNPERDGYSRASTSIAIGTADRLDGYLRSEGLPPTFHQTQMDVMRTAGVFGQNSPTPYLNRHRPQPGPSNLNPNAPGPSHQHQQQHGGSSDEESDGSSSGHGHTGGGFVPHTPTPAVRQTRRGRGRGQTLMGPPVPHTPLGQGIPHDPSLGAFAPSRHQRSSTLPAGFHPPGLDLGQHHNDHSPESSPRFGQSHLPEATWGDSPYRPSGSSSSHRPSGSGSSSHAMFPPFGTHPSQQMMMTPPRSHQQLPPAGPFQQQHHFMTPGPSQQQHHAFMTPGPSQQQHQHQLPPFPPHLQQQHHQQGPPGFVGGFAIPPQQQHHQMPPPFIGGGFAAQHQQFPPAGFQQHQQHQQLPPAGFHAPHPAHVPQPPVGVPHGHSPSPSPSPPPFIPPNLGHRGGRGNGPR